MKSILALFLIAAGLSGAEIPRKAPELVIQFPGRQALLSNYRGYIVAIAFMSTTCPHCQHLSGILGPIQQEYSSKGVQVLGVVFNPEANTELTNFTKVYAHDMFPVGMSTDPIIAAFVQHPQGIHYIPMMAFIDKTGIIRAQHLGIDSEKEHFFDNETVVQNIKGELDKIIKEPTLAGTKKK